MFYKKDNNTYYCDECQFVFGEQFVADLGPNFDGYHEGLHKNLGMTNIPDRFKDIAQGE